jgi:Uma2 family endonuclease
MVTLPPGLLEAPELALYQNEIRARLEDEQRRREKFRDELLPDVKAEFINGEIIVHSPTTVRHSSVRKQLTELLDVYARIHDIGIVLDEKMLIALTRNDYEPDINFFGREKASKLAPEQLILPAPDFIVEVLSPSTEHRDRGVKFRDYAAHGVSEYWLVDPALEVVEQYENSDGRYKLLLKLNTGTIVSRVLVGFEVPIRAVFDEQENLAALRRLLASS